MRTEQKKFVFLLKKRKEKNSFFEFGQQILKKKFTMQKVNETKN